MDSTGTTPGGTAEGAADGTAGQGAADTTRRSAAGRMFLDSGGAFSFFDNVFAVAMTLLVTTITPTASAWRSWSTLWEDSGNQLTAFAISFLLIAVYWWANRKFLSSLRAISPRMVFCNLVMLAFVVLLPVSTNALGEGSINTTGVATVVYAINIAAISTMMVVEFLVARAEDLLDPMPSSRLVVLEVLDGMLAPVVFLVSIPITILVSPYWGRWTWAALFVLGPMSGRRLRAARVAEPV